MPGKREALLEALRKQAAEEMPDVADVPIEEGIGVLGKLRELLSGRALSGLYNPFTKSVGMNLDASDLGDTLAHELTHARQARQGMPRSFYQGEYYEQRPSEMEAFQAEKDRRMRMGLEPAILPGFTDPGNIPGSKGRRYSDIRLKPEKKK